MPELQNNAFLAVVILSGAHSAQPKDLGLNNAERQP